MNRDHLGDLYAESGQTLQGSFSAVSKPNFASKYALESSRRDLHNALLCTVLNAQNFRQKSLKFLLIFSPNFAKLDKFKILQNWQIFSDFEQIEQHFGKNCKKCNKKLTKISQKFDQKI